MAIIDLDTAKKFLKLSEPSHDEEGILTSLVDEVSAAIEDYCRRKFESASFTEYHNGSGTRMMMLRQWPITSVTTVTRTKVDAANTEVSIVAAEYIKDEESGMLIMHAVNHVDSAVWVTGQHNYKIVYEAGYSDSDMPKALKAACKIWLNVLFQKASQNLFAIQSANLGEETLTYANDAIPPQVKHLLIPYRKMA